MLSQEVDTELLIIIINAAAATYYEELLFEVREMLDQYNLDAVLGSFVNSIEESSISHWVENKDFIYEIKSWG